MNETIYDNLDILIKKIWKDEPRIYLLPGDEYEIYRYRLGCIRMNPDYAKEMVLRNFDLISFQLEGDDLKSYLVDTLFSIGMEDGLVIPLTPLSVRNRLERYLTESGQGP